MEAQTDTTRAKTNHAAFAAILAILAGLLGLLPHPWNFTLMGAIGIFAGARLRGWRAFAVPLGVRLATDLVLWQWKYPDQSPIFPFEYLSYVVYVMLGWTLTRTSSLPRILGTSIGASVIFFLLSNFGAWIQLTDLYPRTLAGLMLCYEKGIPFYRGTLLGDLIYTPVLLGVYALAARWLDRRQAARLASEADARS